MLHFVYAVLDSMMLKWKHLSLTINEKNRVLLLLLSLYLLSLAFSVVELEVYIGSVAALTEWNGSQNHFLLYILFHPYPQGIAYKTPSGCLKPWIVLNPTCIMFFPIHIFIYIYTYIYTYIRTYIFTWRNPVTASLCHILAMNITTLMLWTLLSKIKVTLIETLWYTAVHLIT